MEVREKAPHKRGATSLSLFFWGVLGLKNLSKYQSSHLYDYLVGKDDHSVENLRIVKVPLSLRAVLSTSRRKKVFFYFFPMKRV